MLDGSQKQAAQPSVVKRSENEVEQNRLPLFRRQRSPAEIPLLRLGGIFFMYCHPELCEGSRMGFSEIAALPRP